MQTPYEKTPTSKCIELGLFSQNMLGKFSENLAVAPLSEKLGASTQALALAQTGYDMAKQKLIAARVEVQYADYTSDRHVRTLQRIVELADGVKKGRLATAIFPEGVTPIIRSAGATQVSEMRALEGRLEAIGSQWESAASERAKLASERQRYEAALAVRRAADEAVEDMRARRDAAKVQFLDTYAQVTAQVKAAFPRDHAMQDLFFDDLSNRGPAESDSCSDGLEIPLPEEKRLQV
jgi:hypothetical protein